ncbi:glycerophosphodiester phosphodiesterase family protein [Reinekea marina]|uniref:glycerophosphodiester phosphodiesterase n=1 Tax=Reinekea marina TaxID=1310421 RepID=A0ABV7WM75_9GAMM|nr:glycerophosphodiester phosphodiesterase family protein [Reinekea marina]MDN3650732.1 glycerophosphodiester phosphodiesterase family protein [Reinekea marina]
MKKPILSLCLMALGAVSVSQHLFADSGIEVGVRPYYLINDMEESSLKNKLLSCQNKKSKVSTFSIGHRGAPMQFPEHTKESYLAAARMGAGIIECDVTFTKDKELVCRHSQSDLHTTTNILLTPLAEKCSVPFTPAKYDENGNLTERASATCKTTDITLAEFKTLKGKMDAANPAARTVEEYVNATAAWRTDLYSGNGTLMSHKESIELFKELGVKMTPELKSASVEMPYQGTYTQQDYAQQMINEYIEAGVRPRDVFAQSFNIDDVKYWIENEPAFGNQAVFLDGASSAEEVQSRIDNMESFADQGIQYIAPPIWTLLALNGNNDIVPSEYANAANDAGLNIITWSLERSGLLQNGGGWYYQTIQDAIDDDGDMYEVVDVLAQEVGVVGIFSDWPATTTYYANCMGLK